MAHLVLPYTKADPSQNQKSHFLPTHGQTRQQFFLNTYYLEKRYNQNVKAILTA
jgi:hypothetical protein